ncbi:hypothetical protein [Micromonospora sp. U21]|uniref:hypothetical protein n=1 Tax=Micromonospora sp. U21 TaxID=2824899 RepID=UPI001B3867C8|nr:hypothetical protein [Micromonospora sp. U21]MBQ0906977.1 hypothetical protein [Micromonospora sp. U21]
MATFNQQNQTVQHQVNADSAYVNVGHRYLVEKIDDLISQASRENNGKAMAPALAYLHQARAVSAAGDEGRAAALLRRAAEVAGPVATIATSIAAVAQAAQ